MIHNSKQIKYIKLVTLNLILVIFLSLGVISCAHKRPIVVASYEGLGTTISSVGKAAKVLCEEEKIKQKDCNRIKDVYNQIVASYKDAGDLYVEVIKTGSDEAVSNYKAHLQVVFEGLKILEKYISNSE